MEEETIRVEAPNALLGFLLVLRLHDIDADVLPADNDRWIVEIAPGAPRERVISAIRHWLDDEALEAVTVTMDGTEHRLTRR